MKKFLSLLLALTMVMSLVVVPARATDVQGTIEGVPSVLKDSSSVDQFEMTTATSVTLTSDRGTTKLKYGQSEVTNITNTYYAWTVPSGADIVSVNSEGVVTPLKAGNATIRCTITMYGKISTQDQGEESPTEKTVSAQAYKDVTVTVSNPAFSVNDIASVSYKGRICAVTTSPVSVPYFPVGGETSTLDSNGWSVVFKSTSVYSFKECSFANNTLTVKAKEEGAADVALTINPTETRPSFTAALSSDTIGKNASVTLSASSYSREGVTPTYVWTYGNNNTEIGKGASLTWKPVVASGATYPVAITVKCTAYEGSVKTAEQSFDIQVTEDDYVITLPAVGKLPTNAANIFTLVPGTAAGSNFQFYKNDANKTHIALNVTYTYSSSAPSVATISSDGKISTLAAGSTNITITATYNGAAYTRTFAVQVVNPIYTLGSTYCGYNNSSYNANTLVSYANSALSAAGITGVTPRSVELSSASGNVVTATGTKDTGYTLAASPTYLGTADLTATVTKDTGGTFTMTFKVPVLPIPYSTSVIGTAYAEPYTTGSNYYYNTYRVTLPTTFNQYSVVSKNASPNYNVSSAPTSGVTTVTLNQNEFVNGQCTLYVIAWNSNYNGYNYGTNYYGKYYSGAITVYQNSNDIEYTGVAGSTVNFAHSSFTAFMNSMNTASSSYYYQFEDVTFDYFSNSTQGTLYYGSTAMTSGSYSSSSYFNSATKITNLDNVSFAINSRIPSTVKEIVVPFKLHAKQYYNNNAYGTAVTFSGRVVISVAREDIIINVAAGDTVKLDASAFLSYLRASSTAYRNSNIDYVTFDQNISNSSNSSLVNGALYTYYTNSYSFGSAVKSSDRFYYSSTAYNVSNLSDVAFRSNAYATAGTTVYIPFTIKLLNSNATVSGTLAAKISAAVNFYDVKASDYYYDAVKWAVGQGVTKGTGNNMFSPSKGCTRAEIVTFLWRAAGSKAPKSYSNRFTDVSSGMGSDFYNAILWAVGEGITTGTSTTTFSPNATCTRGQIVTFLHRYQKTPGGYYANSFKDVKSGDYCYNAVIWAYGSGVAKGTSNTTFSPNKTCTRGDAVTFLYRAIAK